MSPDLIKLATAFLPFAISMSFTPGPNNIMVANSGAQFGFARTLPVGAGVVLGFALLTTVVGLGMVQVVRVAPGLFAIMKFASIVYLLFLAWNIATAEGVKAGAPPARPISFLQAAAFQWINPKGWIMALGAVTTYTSLGSDMIVQVLAIVVLFIAVGTVSTSTWTLFGQLIKRFLTTRRKRIAFNLTMAALLVASVAPVIFEHF